MAEKESGSWFDDVADDMLEEQAIQEEWARVEDFDVRAMDDGDTWEVRLVDVQPRPTKYGGGYALMGEHVRGDKKGEVSSLFASRYQLKTGVEDAAPAKGSLMVIRYGGSETTDKGFVMHKYQVRCQEDDVAWWRQLQDKLTELQLAKDQRERDKIAEQAADMGPDEDPF